MQWWKKYSRYVYCPCLKSVVAIFHFTVMLLFILSSPLSSSLSLLPALSLYPSLSLSISFSPFLCILPSLSHLLCPSIPPSLTSPPSFLPPPSPPFFSILCYPLLSSFPHFLLIYPSLPLPTLSHPLSHPPPPPHDPPSHSPVELRWSDCHLFSTVTTEASWKRPYHQHAVSFAYVCFWSDY